MAKKGKKSKGKGSSFVRDAAGRFAAAAGAGLGRVAKEALAAGEEELTAVAKEQAKRAVREADTEWKAAKQLWNDIRKPGTAAADAAGDQELEEAERRYKKAIRSRANARATLAEKE